MTDLAHMAGVHNSLAPASHALSGIRESRVYEQQTRDQARQEVYNELRSIVTVLRGNEPQPITINNISTAQTQSLIKGPDVDNKLPRRSAFEVIADTINTFFSNGFNRVCFCLVSGIGTYVVWSFYQHKWRMAELQKRIDANFLLRGTQWLFDGESRPASSGRASGSGSSSSSDRTSFTGLLNSWVFS